MAKKKSEAHAAIMLLGQELFDKIENDGYDAFADGQKRSDNPHNINSVEHTIWLGGFDEAGKREQPDY